MMGNSASHIRVCCLEIACLSLRKVSMLMKVGCNAAMPRHIRAAMQAGNGAVKLPLVDLSKGCLKLVQMSGEPT